MVPGAASVPWVAKNLSATTAFRQSIIEFLDPAPKHTEAEVAALLGAAVYTTEVGTAKLFENARCRVWDFSFGPGGGDSSVVHQHVLDCELKVACAGWTAAQTASLLVVWRSSSTDRTSRCRVGLVLTSLHASWSLCELLGQRC